MTRKYTRRVTQATKDEVIRRLTDYYSNRPKVIAADLGISREVIRKIWLCRKRPSKKMVIRLLSSSTRKTLSTSSLSDLDGQLESERLSENG